MPSVSIIIPVYNVEEFLDECVQSALAQSYSDFELILVDDGSTDACPQFCDQYQEEDRRVRVIHKENGGLASAVKAGVLSARGEFLFFLDGDDVLNSRALEKYMQLYQETGADLICGYCTPDRSRALGEVADAYSYQTFKTEEILGEIISNGRVGEKFTENNRCGKLFRSSSVVKNIDLYNPEIKKGEDQMMTLPMLLTANKIVDARELPYTIIDFDKTQFAIMLTQGSGSSSSSSTSKFST